MQAQVETGLLVNRAGRLSATVGGFVHSVRSPEPPPRAKRGLTMVQYQFLAKDAGYMHLNGQYGGFYILNKRQLLRGRWFSRCCFRAGRGATRIKEVGRA
jgi:hypothetical protein